MTMSRGVPIAIKCPKCRRGQHNYPNKVLGVRKTGLVEKHTTRLQAHGRRIGARDPEEARKVAIEFVERTAKEYKSEHFERKLGDVIKTDLHLIDLKEEPQIIATEFRHG